MRKLVAAMEQSGQDANRLSALIKYFASLRRSTSEIVTVFINKAVQIFPEGYGVVQGDVLRQLPEPIIERILVRLTMVFGGKTYPPRRDRLVRAVTQLKKAAFRGFTLGGCRFSVKSNEIMICREMRGISTRQIASRDSFVWDNLFAIEISGVARSTASLAPLGKKGWVEILQKSPELREISLPHPVRLTLPALFDQKGVSEVPHLNFRRESSDTKGLGITKAEFLNYSLTKNLSN
jgi:tRNA(Ile)-lysidine synthase